MHNDRRNLRRFETVIIVYLCNSLFFLLTMTNTNLTIAKIKITPDKANSNYHKIYAEL